MQIFCRISDNKQRESMAFVTQDSNVLSMGQRTDNSIMNILTKIMKMSVPSSRHMISDDKKNQSLRCNSV